jgi:hypothetical protein
MNSSARHQFDQSMFPPERIPDEGEQQQQQKQQITSGFHQNYHDKDQQRTSPIGFDSDMYTGITPLLSSPRDHAAGLSSTTPFDDSSSSSSSSTTASITGTSTPSTKTKPSVIAPFEQEISQHHELYYHYAHRKYWFQRFCASINDWLYPPDVPRSCQLLRKENLAVPASYLLVGILQGK